MKKLITAYLIASTIAFSPALKLQADSIGPTTADESASSFQDGTSNSPQAQDQSPAPEKLPTTEDPTIPLAPPETDSPPEATAIESIPSDEEDDAGTSVGQAASEGSKAAKRKQWQNIAIATIAVAAAVTALVLIASNDGHHSKD